MSMVHSSVGMKKPASPYLLSEPAIIAGIAKAALPRTKTRWDWYVEDYDRIRDTMAKVLDGFEDFNRRVRLPLGFRIKQPARELVFLTPSGKAEFSAAPLPDVVPAAGTLLLGTMRSHDQWNTTIYSDDDRYRGIKNLRTLVFLNKDDMRERGIAQFDPVDIAATSKDGSKRSLAGLPGRRVRHPARLRRRLHAGDERAGRHQGLQRAERPAADEAPEGDDHSVRARRRDGSTAVTARAQQATIAAQ